MHKNKNERKKKCCHTSSIYGFGNKFIKNQFDIYLSESPLVCGDTMLVKFPYGPTI